MKAQADINLIQSILKGNQGAQEVLYDKYKKIITDFLGKKYSLYRDIEDDVSEILIKVFMNLETYDKTKSRFKSWVLSITKNHMIDKWRSNTVCYVDGTGSYTTDCVTATCGSSFVTSSNTDALLTGTLSVNNTADISFENCSSVNHITTQISAVDYTLLDMKYVQGYNYDEIGNEFNLTSTTISNRVNYIKTKLKKNNSEIIYD